MKTGFNFSIQYFKILWGNLLPKWWKKLKNTSKKSCPRNKLNEEDWYDVECQSLENNNIIDNDNQDESRKKVVATGTLKSNRAVLTKAKKGEKKIRSFKKSKKKSNYKSYSATATWPSEVNQKEVFYQHTTSFPPNFQS